MSPPETLVRRWRKLKKRCSFSSSDRLVRSKSFTEQDVLKGQDEERDKYLTVGSRDVNKFQGIREKINQWNTDLKKKRSTENLNAQSRLDQSSERGQFTRDESSMFVLASPQQGYVKSALVVSSTTKDWRTCPRNSTPTKTGEKGVRDRHDVMAWSSPSPSPPASDDSSDFSHDNQRTDSYVSHSHLYQDQDSGYDGFCPEKSIYSTGSSDTSSLLSSEGLDHSSPSGNSDLLSKLRTRPRPSPIYEKHGDYGDTRNQSLGHYGTISPRAKIAQATVINLVKTRSLSPDSPPPLPPRPSLMDSPSSLPPLPNPKPRSRQIQHGAVSLPRKRADFHERARRRGSYHDSENIEKKSSDLVLDSEEKVRGEPI